MPVEIFTASKPTRTKNDDIAGYQGDVYWLLDGATQLVQPEHGLDASWHVGEIDAAFRKILTQDRQIVLSELAKAAISDVAATFYKTTGLDDNAAQELRPFATLILMRVEGDTITYLIVADSTLAVIGKGRETASSDRRIDSNNPLAATDGLLRQGKGFDSDEYKQAMREVYLAGNQRINMPGGFDVIGQNPDIIDSALSGTITVSPDDTILLMSDGFTRAVDTLGLYPSWTALLAGIEQKGGEAILKEIRDAETADYGGLHHQRSSRHDDATCMILKTS